MKKALKFLHSLGGIGVIGALAANIILLTVTPEPSSLEEYVVMRRAIGAVAQWLLLPSLGVVIVSGLFSMAVHKPFQNAGWAYMKLGLGVIMFEGTLLSVQGPAERAAIASQRALAGEVDPATLAGLVQGEWGSLWVILGVALANVALAIWRPRFSRRKQSGQPA
jgi:hypothetical protein